MIDLDDEAVEDGFVDGFCEFNELSKFGLDSLLVGVFTVGDDIDVGVRLHEE